MPESLTPEDRALIERVMGDRRTLYYTRNSEGASDLDVFAALLATAREEGYAAAMREGQAVELHLLEKLEAAREHPRQPPEDVREKVARIVDPFPFDLYPESQDNAPGSLDPRERADLRAFVRATAYAKADAILAIALPAVAVGDGWRDNGGRDV